MQYITLKPSALIIIVMAMISCSQPNKTIEKPSVTVSIVPQKYFIEKLLGNQYNINVLIMPGANPVTYEPTAKQMQAMAQSEFYFRMGHTEFERSWFDKFHAANPNIKVVNLSDGLPLLEEHHDCKHEHPEHAHEHTNGDPHTWMSPGMVKLIALKIKSTFEQSNPELRDTLEKNYHAFIQEVDSIDKYIHSKLDSLENRDFIIFHPALSYYAKDYNLNQWSIEFEGKEPTPAVMKNIIETAKAKQIKTIFIQQQFDMENATTIANEIGANVVQIDPLAYDWKKSLISITDSLCISLGGKKQNE